MKKRSARKGVRYGTAFFLVVATAFVTAIITYYYLSMVVADLGKNQQLYNKFNNVNKIVSTSYIGTIDPIDGYETIIDGAVSGYINGINDPYSYYLDEHDYKLSYVADDSVDIGVKTDYDYRNSGIRVTFIKNGSPARNSDLRVGDVILSVDGTTVSERGYRSSVQRLSGSVDSETVLAVYREETDENLLITVRRSAYTPNTISYRLIENDIGYILIDEFDSTTFKSFSSAFSELMEKGARGFILDVRYCYSGDLDSVVSILDMLTPTAVLVSVNEKSTSVPTLYRSDEQAVSVPLIVLQNSDTAGVAEVFSGSLRDTSRAVLVGEVTAGLGLGQRDIVLGDGSAIHLSTYEYVLPSGEKFNGVGITPNFISELSEEKKTVFEELTDEEDDQLQFALSKLREQIGN